MVGVPHFKFGFRGKAGRRGWKQQAAFSPYSSTVAPQYFACISPYEGHEGHEGQEGHETTRIMAGLSLAGTYLEHNWNIQRILVVITGPRDLSSRNERYSHWWLAVCTYVCIYVCLYVQCSFPTTWMGV